MIGEIAFRQKKHKDAVEHFLEAALGYPYEEWQALGVVHDVELVEQPLVE